MEALFVLLGGEVGWERGVVTVALFCQLGALLGASKDWEARLLGKEGPTRHEQPTFELKCAWNTCQSRLEASVAHVPSSSKLFGTNRARFCSWDMNDVPTLFLFILCLDFPQYL
jgi:hypothetical protein